MNQTGFEPQLMFRTVLRQCFEGAALEWYNSRQVLWNTWGDFLADGEQTFGDDDGHGIRVINQPQRAGQSLQDFVWQRYGELKRYRPHDSEGKKLAQIRESILPRFKGIWNGQIFMDIISMSASAKVIDANDQTYKSMVSSQPRRVPFTPARKADVEPKSAQPVAKTANGGTVSFADKLKNLTCFKCGKKGHFSRDCQSNPTKNSNESRKAFIRFLEANESFSYLNLLDEDDKLNSFSELWEENPENSQSSELQSPELEIELPCAEKAEVNCVGANWYFN
jgi:hypothetical protein